MELNLDSGRLVLFLGGLSFFFVLETIFPARRWLGSRLKRLSFHAAVATFNTVLVRVLIYVPFLLWIVYVEQQGWGVLPTLLVLQRIHVSVSTAVSRQQNLLDLRGLPDAV